MGIFNWFKKQSKEQVSQDSNPKADEGKHIVSTMPAAEPEKKEDDHQPENNVSAEQQQIKEPVQQVPENDSFVTLQQKKEIERQKKRIMIVDDAEDMHEQFLKAFVEWQKYMKQRERTPNGSLHFTSDFMMNRDPKELQLRTLKDRLKAGLKRAFRELGEYQETGQLEKYCEIYDIWSRRFSDAKEILETAQKELETARQLQDKQRSEKPEPASETETESVFTAETLPEEADPAGGGTDWSQDFSELPDGSLSISMSKNSVVEKTDSSDSAGLVIREHDNAISNEVIHKGTRILDTYEVLAEGIKGGMGSVWKVHHNSWNVDLAMKRPQPRFFAEGSATRKENFIHECEAWIDLGLHPNIVSCYYVREIGGVPTIFSEWMENGSLENRIKDGTLYEVTDVPDSDQKGIQEKLQARLLDIAIQFAGGLQYAHTNGEGLIHQDVKPDNLLLTNDWTAKVADFGLAKARAQMQESAEEENASEAGTTHMAPTGGYTPAYCSSEQFRGEKLTRRTDIYSWAVSVLEMYLGERMWDSGMEAGRNCGSYFSQCRVTMPEELKTLLKQCLDSEEENRSHDFGVIREKLKAIYKHVLDRDYPRPEPEAASDTADSLNNRALSYLDLGKTEEAKTLWEEALRKTPDHLTALYNQGLYLWRNSVIDDEELIRRLNLPGQSEKTEGLAGRWYSQICGERGISEESPFEESGFLYKLGETGKKRQVIDDQGSICMVPDGSNLYCAVWNESGENEIICVDTNTWQVVFRISGRGPVKLSADRQWILFRSDDKKTLKIANASDGSLLNTIRCQEVITDFCLHPDGQFCFISAEKELMKYHLPSGACIRRAAAGDCRLGREQRFSDDGRALYQAGCGFYLQWNTDTLKIRQKAKLQGSIFIFRNAEKLYRGDTHGFFRYTPGCYDIRELDVNYKGEHSDIWSLRTTKVLFSNEGNDKTILWMNEDESRMLLSSNGRLKLYDAETLRCLCTWFGCDTGVVSASAAGDLSMVACSYADSTVQVFQGQNQVKPAPWELSVARSFAEISEKQEQINRFIQIIEEHTANGNFRQAVQVLHDAELFEGEEGSPEIRHLRHRLSALLRPEKIEKISGSGSVHADSYMGLGNFSIAVSPRDGSVVSGGGDTPGRYMLWNDDLSGEKIWDTPYERRGYAKSLEFSASGRFLAAGVYGESGESSSVSVRDVDQDYRERYNLQLPAGNICVAVSPDEKVLIAGAENGNTAVYDLTTLSCIKVLQGGNVKIMNVGFLQNGALACSADEDGIIRIYDMEDLARIKTLELNASSLFRMVTDPCGYHMYLNYYPEEAAYGDDFISIWDTRTWQETARIPTGHKRSEVFMAVDPFQRIMATVGLYEGKGKIKIWSLSDGSLIDTIYSLEKNISYLTFSADGCTLYASCDNQINTWEIYWKLE